MSELVFVMFYRFAPEGIFLSHSTFVSSLHIFQALEMRCPTLLWPPSFLLDRGAKLFELATFRQLSFGFQDGNEVQVINNVGLHGITER